MTTGGAVPDAGSGTTAGGGSGPTPTPATGPETGDKAARTRQRILAAAAHELARHGYDGATLRNVAAGAGLHQGSLYFHFSSKDELVAEAMRESIDFAYQRVRAALDALAPGAASEVRLQTAIRAHLTALHSNHDRGAAVVRMASTLPSDIRLAYSAHERRYAGLWLGVLQDARDAGVLGTTADLRLIRDLFVGALNSTLDSLDTSDVGLERVATAAYALLTERPGAAAP